MRKRRLFWAVWLIAAAMLWFFENNAATLALLLSSVLLPLLSILSAGHSARRLQPGLHAAAEQNALRAAVSVRAPALFSRIVGRAVCENRLTREVAETALAFPQRLSGTTEAAFAADSAHCGTLRLRAEVWAEDLFGLWRSPAVDGGEDFLTIYPLLFAPQITLTENTTLSDESERYSATRPGSDPSETFSIREYRPGDPIRQIHWKLSGKTDQTMLRELGLPVVNRTLLLFRNLLAPGASISPDEADALATVFLSVSHALLSDGCAHTAAFAEGDRFMLLDVQNEAELRAMESRFLTISWETDDGALERLLAQTRYAHVAIVSAAPVGDGLCRDNRVTVLTTAQEAGASAYITVPFTPEGCRTQLSYLEL